MAYFVPPGSAYEFALATLTRTYIVTSAPEVGVGAAAGEFNPPGILSEEEFGEPTVSAGIAPDEIASAEAFGTPTIAGSGLAFAPEAIESEWAVGTPTIQHSFMPESITSEEHVDEIAVKTRDEPYEIVVTLREGPYDGRMMLVYQPWPRHWISSRTPTPTRSTPTR